MDDLISIILSRKNIYVYIVWSHFHDISEQAKQILDDRKQKKMINNERQMEKKPKTTPLVNEIFIFIAMVPT